MQKYRILAFVFALLLLTFSGCEKAPGPIEPVEPVEGPKLADLKETDTLVVYIIKEYETLSQRRINQFSTASGVNVEVVRVAADEFTERVMNDLAGGSGPDVLFLNDLFTLDIMKAAMNGSFLDLTDILSEDPEFSKNDYLDGVFEACQFEGRQYIVPTSYQVPLAISSKEKLKELKFDWDKIDTMSDYIEEIAHLTPVAIEELGFTYVLYSKNEFHRLLHGSGIPIFDYESGEVLPEEKDLHKFMEAYKTYFPYDYEEGGGTRSISYDEHMLRSGMLAFFLPEGIRAVTDTLSCMKFDSCDYVLRATPGQEEEIVGTIYGQMAISANAKNSLNAYKFIKFMLSEEAQKDSFTTMCMPIHKDAIHEGIHNAKALYKNNGYWFEDEEKLAFSEEEADAIEAAITGVDQFTQRISDNVKNMLFDIMLPYLQDEKSYDDCLKDLKNKLTLYLSE